jgi:hypothetical protein
MAGERQEAGRQEGFVMCILYCAIAMYRIFFTRNAVAVKGSAKKDFMNCKSRWEQLPSYLTGLKGIT